MRIDPESGLDADLIDTAMRAMYQVRSMSPKQLTDEQWAAKKANRIHTTTMRLLRQEAIEDIEAGEWE